MKVLVTGGAGFIGSNVVKVLKEKNAKVVVLDDFSSANFLNLDGLDVEVVCADILDQKIYNKLPKLDAVIHLAAITDTTLKDDRKMMMVNFEGFKNIFSWCAKKQVKLVYASSAAVYGDGSTPMKEEQQLKPLNIYAYSKCLCDRFSMKFLNKKILPLLVGLRYFNVYGPAEYHKKTAASMIYQLYLQMKQNKRPRIFKWGEQKRDFIYIKDVAKITVEALSLKKDLIVNVGTGKARSFNDVISCLNKVLGKNLEPDYFDNPYTEVYQDYTEADTTLFKKVFTTEIQFNLEDGIADYVKNFLEKNT